MSTFVPDHAAETEGPAGAGERFVGLDPRWVARLAGAVVSAPRGETMTTHTPMTGGELAVLPVSTVQDVHLAYVGARAAQPSWAALPATTRAQLVLRFHDLVLAEQARLLDLIQLETGKARLHAFEEIVDTAQVCRHYGRVAPRLLRPRRRAGLVPVLTRVEEWRRPRGVVGIVAPWNYPLSMGVTDVVPALLAGNAVVLRPDPQAALTTLFAVDLLARAGLPSGIVQVVLGDGPSIGAEVLDQADYVCFTGSTRTGREVARRCGERLVGASLELGGKNALYVAADADLDRAVEGAVRACFASAGQLCVATERVYVHDTVADDFERRFLEAVRGLRLRLTLSYDADLGSLVSARQLARVEAHVKQACAAGARVLTGGRARPDIGPFCYEPTVLGGVTSAMDVCREETFGPVVSLYRVGSDAEAIARVNDSAYGLNASVWTRDPARGLRFAAAVQAGTINVNEGYSAAYASTAAPMGGMKASGLGRRHGVEGLLAYTEAQTVASQRVVGLGAARPVSPEAFTAAVGHGLRVMKALGRA